MATKHAHHSQWKDALLPQIVDHLSLTTPSALYAEYPISPTTYTSGYRRITYRDFSNAINGAAWWLFHTLSSSTNHEVLAYIGPNDIRYTTFVLAAVKVGYVLFATSPRNSVAAHERLFEELGCRKLLSPEPKPPAVTTILESYSDSMQHFAVPSVEDLLDKQYPVFPYEKRYEEALHEPLMVIHTSGSTGFPKPLIYSHEGVARNMNMLSKDHPSGFQSMDRLVQGKRVLNCFPPFHGAYLASHLFAGIPFGTVMIAPLAATIPTAQGIVEALHYTSAQVALLVPSIVLELSQDDALLDFCARNLERVLYCGGDLPQAVGNKVSGKLELMCQYGASEIGITPQLLPEQRRRRDWKYVSFHPCLGLEFREIAEREYELFVRRDKERENEQPVFTLFPGSKEYGSRDLFKQHPTIPDFWSWCARSDDIIVFLNGEKTNPNSMEQHIIARNPEVLTAIVVGTQRFQAALLVEPAPVAQPGSPAEEAAFIERIWSSVEEANQIAPAHARVEKAMILLTSPEKPVIRAGKGTMQRAATVSEYTDELDRLYQNADLVSDEGVIEPHLQFQDIDSISETVRNIVGEVTGSRTFDDETNFFALGLDSLLALRMTRMLRRRYRVPDMAVASIYNNPSVAQLSLAVQALQANKQSLQVVDQRAREQVLRSVLHEYREGVHGISKPVVSSFKQREKHTVAFTGSTGGLGTYLLEYLLKDPNVEHIYCLKRKNPNRASIIHRANTTIFASPKGNPRVTFLEADLAQPSLGLPPSTYTTLLASTTVILHNAWPVNFNLPLSAFRPQFIGLLNLFRLSASSNLHPAIFFISSISSVSSFRSPSKMTPEEIIPTIPGTGFANGYAESKFVSELLCDEASRFLGIKVCVARVGQIAGPVLKPGVWNLKEWFPSLVVSSVRVRALPESLGGWMERVDWVPVDLLAGILVGLLVRCDEDVDGRGIGSGAAVLHLQNSKTISWDSLLPVVKSIIEDLTKTSIDVVPAQAWIVKIREDFEGTLKGVEESSGGKVADEELEILLKENPAVKLLDFYSSSMSDTAEVNVLSLEKTLVKSELLGALEGVNADWMKKWISEWLLFLKG